jgi:hypothetical protein
MRVVHFINGWVFFTLSDNVTVKPVQQISSFAKLVIKSTFPLKLITITVIIPINGFLSHSHTCFPSIFGARNAQTTHSILTDMTEEQKDT